MNINEYAQKIKRVTNSIEKVQHANNLWNVKMQFLLSQV